MDTHKEEPMKKLISLLLVLVLAASPAARAAGVPAEAEPPVISVSVPDTGTVIVNPYRLPVELDGQETTEQIAGSTMILENRGNVAVDVSVSAIGSPTGGVVFTARPPAESATEKELFLYAEFQPLSDPVLRPGWSGWYSDSTNQILVSAQGAAKADVLRLEAGGAPYSWGAARLFGSAAACPAQPWEAGDGFHVNLAFTFTPAAAETAASDIPGGSEFDSALVLPPEQSAEPAPVAPPDPVIVPPDPVVVPPETPVPPDLPAVPDQAPEAEGDEEPEAPPVPETGDVAGPTE
ncbi:MAG: hypothetical protein K2P26_02090 [Oscillospiraceae bacterium]|nr:hypothetical protein [Oscillospiraceae bacterium]